jgi:hypothetical protein
VIDAADGPSLARLLPESRKVGSLQPGPEREDFLKKIAGAATAINIDRFANPPGLRPPNRLQEVAAHRRSAGARLRPVQPPFFPSNSSR